MLETVQQAPPDAILGLTEAFNRDENPNKINLSVGVYQDAEGRTPVLRSVKAAERRLVDQEPTKGYLGIDGLPSYAQHVRRMIGGEKYADRPAAVLQTPGGTGGLRLAADFIGTQLGGSRIWLSNPTWANHQAVFAAAGLPVEIYPYLNSDRTDLDFDAMLGAIEQSARAGDTVLLHACCHNPTGVDLNEDQWKTVAELLVRKNLLPLVDFAYQGFGNGLEEDARGVRIVLEHCPEALVVSSFSKNFGLYSERVGALAAFTGDETSAAASLSQLKRLVRSNWSNPPRHGASIVTTILDDAELTAQWKEELAEMRGRIAAMRRELVAGMQQRAQERDFSFLEKQNGMFSFSGLTPMQVDRLRSEYSIYIVGSGRINVAGITPSNRDRLCDSIAAVL